MPGSIRIKTINHVGIPIWDRRVALPFYRDILGLQVIPSMVDSPNIVWARTLDGTMVHLIEPADGENLGRPHVAFEVEDFDSTVESVQNSGYPDITEAGERHDGQRHIFATDNDGNRLEFATAGGHRPSSRVADALGYTSETGENVVVDSPSTIKIITINHVGLPVNDRAECMLMYRDLLNLGVIPHQVDGNSLAWTEMADGSCLVTFGRTRVLCTASVGEGVPSWMRNTGRGWVTAEYSMLPGSSSERIRRRVSGRDQEIQRLIGRSLRAVIYLDALGEREVVVDCDVLQADGGTRTASICGGYVALHDALTRLVISGQIAENPLHDGLAAISVGIVDGGARLDLPYVEDSTAEVDFNVVMTGSGGFVEVQGTAEGEAFERSQLDELVDLASTGIAEIIAAQRALLADPPPARAG